MREPEREQKPVCVKVVAVVLARNQGWMGPGVTGQLPRLSQTKY
jgi:hypothetical protein